MYSVIFKSDNNNTPAQHKPLLRICFKFMMKGLQVKPSKPDHTMPELYHHAHGTYIRWSPSNKCACAERKLVCSRHLFRQLSKI